MKLLKGIIKGIFTIVGLILLLIVVVVAVATISEYRPEEVEQVEIVAALNGSSAESEESTANTEADGSGPMEGDSAEDGENTKKLPSPGESFTLMTWNIGYGALGDNADFFMDGGTSVKTADAARIEENMTGIAEIVKSIDPDISFFQEVDISATRSEHRNEFEDIRNILPDCCSAFAYNFNVLFIPYPIPPMGHVEAGVMTAAKWEMEDARRYSLTNPFKWPIRCVNLKRCMLTSRIPIEGTDKELVLVNFHLEAYDDGEGKRAQTALVKRFLEEEVKAGNYVIAGGDFNQTFDNVDTTAYPVIDGSWQAGIMDSSEYEENFNIIMDDRVPSCRSLKTPYAGVDKSEIQFYVIDGFILSKNLEIESYETLDQQFKYSDHNPLVVSLRIIE